MATEKGSYTLQTEDMNTPNKTLCFICAVQEAMHRNPTTTKIFFQTGDMDYAQCDTCREFIEDSVTI